MMNVVLHSIVSSFSLWRIILIVYVFQFMLAVTVGLQVYNVVEASIGDSMSVQNLLSSYDYTVANDFLLHHGASISPLIGQMRWLILIYMIFSIFINAGVLYSVNHEKSNWLSFFEGGAQYFFRFLKISCVFLLMFAIWSALLWLPVLSKGTSLLESLPNEKYYLSLLVVICLLYLLGIVFFITWSIASKLAILRHDVSTWSSIKMGLRWTLRNYFRSHFLFIGLAILVIIVGSVYMLLNHKIGMVSGLTIIFIFIIQQLFILFRIASRCMLYIGMSRLYSTHKYK